MNAFSAEAVGGSYVIVVSWALLHVLYSVSCRYVIIYFAIAIYRVWASLEHEVGSGVLETTTSPLP